MYAVSTSSTLNSRSVYTRAAYIGAAALMSPTDNTSFIKIFFIEIPRPYYLALRAASDLTLLRWEYIPDFAAESRRDCTTPIGVRTLPSDTYVRSDCP